MNNQSTANPALTRMEPRQSRIWTTVFVGAAAYLLYLIVGRIAATRRIRRRYKDIPSLPRHWLLGNIVNAGEKLNPSLNRHPDYGIEEIWIELGCPPAFFFDLMPIDTGVFVVADPSVAEQIVQPSTKFKYSVPKSDTLKGLTSLTGAESLLMMEGEVWKNLRKRFSRGFSPAHLHSLSPLVTSKTQIFVDRLKSTIKSEVGTESTTKSDFGTTFTMRDFAQDLTTDIITTIAILKDFGSQSVPEGEGPKSRFGILTASRLSSSLVYKVGQGFDPVTFFDPIRPIKAWFYEQIVNRELDALIRQQLKADQKRQEEQEQEQKSEGGGKNSYAKAIVQLALSGLTPTNELVVNTRSQIKTFLFAGQDTTATTIQWLCYELSKASHSPEHATALAALRSEHDTVFGSNNNDPFSSLDLLSDPTKSEQILGSKLPHTTAFVKETLRLHPPAATARRCDEKDPTLPRLELSISDKLTDITDLRIYPCQWIIHRNPQVWGDDATEFRPGRWLDEEYVNKLPPGAFRPFERGPRNCIGQELAMIELKMVLCAVARGFVFEKVGQTGRGGEGGSDDKEVWNVHQVTSVPSDGMIMRVRLRGRDE